MAQATRPLIGLNCDFIGASKTECTNQCAADECDECQFRD